MTTPRFACGWLAALAFACSARRVAPLAEKPRAAHGLAAAPAPSPVVPVSAASASARCAEPPPPTLSEASLRAAVRGWQSAQKKGDFAAFSGFYGEHFSGLLASGASVPLLNRQAWLAARSQDFGQGKSSEGTAQLAFGAGGAQVVLGADELFFVPTTSGPKIAWQARTPEPTVALSEKLGQWLADEDSALLSAHPDPNWAEGPPSLRGPEQVTRSVAVARLPKALRAWLGRRVKLLGVRGPVCETRLQRFALRAQITPDLRTAEHWEGCADGPPIAPQIIAEEVWRLSASAGRSLVAEFSAPCKGALLAVDPDLPEPLIAAPEPASAELGARALEAFRQLPAYLSIQARYRAEHPDQDGAWDDHDARRTLSTVTLKGHAPLLFVSVAAGSGCAGFSAGLSALWQGGLGGPASVLTALDAAPLTPRAAVDLGGPEPSLLLGPDGLFQARSVIRWRSGKDSGYERAWLLQVPFFAGPC